MTHRNRFLRYRNQLSGRSWQGLCAAMRGDSADLSADVVWELFERGLIDSYLMVTDLGRKVADAR